jgi:hypothetical protein
MPRKKKVAGYEEKNYLQKRAIYDSIVQALEDIKHGTVHGGHGWNLPVEHVKGLTARLIGEENLELTYHHIETATVEDLARMEQTGKEFLGEAEKELKKRFKKLTGKALKLKKVKEDRGIDKASRIQAETSWMVGSSRHGFGGRPYGRYLVRDSRIYKIDATLDGVKSELDK